MTKAYFHTFAHLLTNSQQTMNCMEETVNNSSNKGPIHFLLDGKDYIELVMKADNSSVPTPSKNPSKRPRVRCDKSSIAHKVRILYLYTEFIIHLLLAPPFPALLQ